MARLCQYSIFHPSDKNSGSRTSEASVDLRLRLRPLVPRFPSWTLTQSTALCRVRIVSSRRKQASIAQSLPLRHQNK